MDPNLPVGSAPPPQTPELPVLLSNRTHRRTPSFSGTPLPPVKSFLFTFPEPSRPPGQPDPFTQFCASQALSGPVSSQATKANSAAGSAIQSQVTSRLQRVHSHQRTLHDTFYAIKDPLQRALFLLKEVSTDLNPFVQFQVDQLIKAVCHVDSLAPDSLLQKDHLSFANEYVTLFCFGSEFEARVRGLKKWILFQALVLLRQVQVMQLSIEDTSPKFIVGHLQKVVRFFLSLPKTVDKIDPKPPTSLEKLQMGLVMVLQTLFPHPDLKGTPSDCLLAADRFLATDSPYSFLKCHAVKPIQKTPNISDVGLSFPKTTEPHLTKTRKQLAKEPLHPTMKAFLAVRLAYYSPNLMQEALPPELTQQLHHNIGSLLHHSSTVHFATYERVGKSCVASNEQRSIAVYGAILTLHRRIREYIQTSNKDWQSQVEPNQKVFRGFDFFQIHSLLLERLRYLKKEIFPHATALQSAQQLDDTILLLSSALVELFQGPLSAPTKRPLSDWIRKTRFNPIVEISKDKQTSKSIHQTSESLLGFRTYFLLDHLIQTCKDCGSSNQLFGNTLFKLLSQFPPQQRNFLLLPICGTDHPFSSPSALWRAAKTAEDQRGIFLFTSPEIAAQAEKAVATLLASHTKPK